MLNLFRSHTEIGVYYAAGKTTALALFVQYSIGLGLRRPPRGCRSREGPGEDPRTFRRSRARDLLPLGGLHARIVAIGYPVLYAFGERFTEAYPLMFILAIGVLARSSIGPSETVLNMLGPPTRLRHRLCDRGERLRCTQLRACAVVRNLWRGHRDRHGARHECRDLLA